MGAGRVEPREVARRLVQRTPRLTSFPVAAGRAGRVAQDPDSGAEELVEAFAQDAALTSHLLKVASSDLYGRIPEVRSVARATELLGRVVLRNVALAASMRAIVHEVEAERSVPVSSLWRHAVRAAAAAAVLAEETGAWEPQEAFAAGLVHDLGVLVELEGDELALAALIEQAQRVVPEERSNTIQVMELSCFGASHQHFGGALCEAWGLPGALRDVTEHHHDPLQLEGVTRKLAAVVHTAESLGGYCEHGVEEQGGELALDGRVLELLGLDRIDLRPLIERLRQVCDRAEAAFS